jgi:hypothetical protein
MMQFHPKKADWLFNMRLVLALDVSAVTIGYEFTRVPS